MHIPAVVTVHTIKQEKQGDHLTLKATEILNGTVFTGAQLRGILKRLNSKQTPRNCEQQT